MLSTQGLSTQKDCVSSWVVLLRTSNPTQSFGQSVALGHSARSVAVQPGHYLRDAAIAYKVDTDIIAAKGKQEFTAKEKTKKAPQAATKPVRKAA